jgi:prefoldin alpha subunit
MTTLDNKPILVPLTNSLYVAGTLSDASHVLVDVGTGFYVEKVPLSLLLFSLAPC